MSPASGADVLEAALERPVLVFGSLPPSGRDLDLLLRDDDVAAVASALENAGFVNEGIQWVRFRGCDVDAVDAVRASSWRLSARAIADLYTAAVPVPGHKHLLQPSAAHSLVILARRVVRGGGELSDAKRERVRVALAAERGDWARSHALARDWNSYGAVIALERLYKSGRPPSRRRRAAALAEFMGAGAQGRARAEKTVWARRGGAGVIALSGLDGSGKSSQAEALRRTLEKTLGDTVVVWTRLSYNPSLRALAKPIKAVLAARGSSPRGGEPTDAGKALRRRSAVVTQLWATVVAIANGLSQRRVVRYHLNRGRIVICDRYTLDSRVHLRYRYGPEKRFRFQAWLVKALSVEPRLSYFLRVPPEEALARKKEQYDLAQLELQARLYEEESAAAGAGAVDSTRAREELCEKLAAEVWAALR